MRSSNPPTDEEIGQILKEATYHAARLPITVIPATGLPPTDFFHIHEDWITWPTEDAGQDYPIITVPVEEECRRKTKARGQSKNTAGIVNQNEPCSVCKSNGTAKFQSPSSLEFERKVPVVDKRAAEELCLWFEKYDTIPWSEELNRLQTVSTDVINRRVSAYDLQFVFGRRAAKMGVSDKIITENMGTKQIPKPILKYQRNFKPKTTGQLTYQQYLNVIDKNSPISVKGISEIIGRSESAVSNMLRKLEKHGFVTRVGQKGEGRQKRDEWDVSVSPDTQLACAENNCGSEFGTFRGLTVHTTLQH